MIPDIEYLRAFATRYAAAWCSLDPARVAAHYAPEGSLTINDGQPATGRAAITEVARGFYVAVPDMQMFMDELVAEGDRIEFHWTFTGTNTGPGGPGNAVRVSGFEEWDRRRRAHRRITRPLRSGVVRTPARTRRPEPVGRRALGQTRAGTCRLRLWHSESPERARPHRTRMEECVGGKRCGSSSD